MTRSLPNTNRQRLNIQVAVPAVTRVRDASSRVRLSATKNDFPVTFLSYEPRTWNKITIWFLNANLFCSDDVIGTKYMYRAVSAHAHAYHAIMLKTEQQELLSKTICSVPRIRIDIAPTRKTGSRQTG
ncbi:hypothetical protein EVAR_22190_1 [Eumeta japonica]|uniref:Uncharacterized protein n=1 Tax=Eumeta variegata TaxID=151549 RepID=A0A4C1UBM4_EUMVA|nr:hypothetical protein EVAR_22190_1 [Eumeta japonica]